MPVQAAVVWDPAFTRYDFGPSHPMAPLRLELTARLCEALGVFGPDAPDDVSLIAPEPATDEVLATVHTPAYIAAVRQASEHPEQASAAFGLGTEDDPAFAGMHEASARIAQGTLEACRAVWQGECLHAVNFCGGMHHAMPDRASGFCIYNDVAVGIRWLLDHGAQRVAYVDIDVHHGDGVERIFWDDPRVLTVSVHEEGRHLFPGTGWPHETGSAQAEGSAVNVALPVGTSDASWLRAIDAVAMPVVRAFRPDVLITQHGADTHHRDPLADLSMTVDAQREAATMLHRLAHEAADGRWVAVGGGGYNVVEVVPRTWTHLTAVAAHRPVPLSTPTPQSWRDAVRTLTGHEAPERMGERSAGDGPIWWRGWESGYEPEHAVDRAVMATRQAVFPQLGLDIWFD